MCKENCTEINLSSSVFNEMRDNFDAILKKALGNIVKGKSGQADINLKLTISAIGENEGQLKPKFKHQVSSVMAIKERESGMVNPNAEMVYDEEEGEYVLRLRLYEVEQRLNPHQFVRISNSEIINLKKIDYFDLSFTGTICVKLRGGTVTYISRRCVPKVKEILGI